MRTVIIESPFAGDVDANLAYLRRAIRHSLTVKGEAPFASHALYTQPGILDDANPAERDHGILAGFAWRRAADATVFYIDRGVSTGMIWGAKDAKEIGHEIVIRAIAPVTSLCLFDAIATLGLDDYPYCTDLNLEHPCSPRGR